VELLADLEMLFSSESSFVSRSAIGCAMVTKDFRTRRSRNDSNEVLLMAVGGDDRRSAAETEIAA